MTKEQYLDRDLPFYHITKTRNLTSIFANGLKNGNGRGICVVRSHDPLIIRFIVEMMLFDDDEVDFSIIEIKPKAIGILSHEIGNDSVVEETNCLHNYIKRDLIVVAPSQVIGSYEANALGIPDKNELVQEIMKNGLLWEFER